MGTWMLTLTLLGSKPGLEVICIISDLIIVEFFYFNMQFPQITERKIYSCSHAVIKRTDHLRGLGQTCWGSYVLV